MANRTLVRLSTIDNPYNPFDQFPEWYAWDVLNEYNSCSLLGRIVVNSDALSPAMQEEATALAIEEIVRENVTGVFIKVTKVVPDQSEHDAELLLSGEG